MQKIKFSLSYPKLIDENGYPIRVCRLLQVLEIDLSDLTQEMRDYDTAHGMYPLPAKGKYLMLIFQKPGHINLFTTIRRSTPEKLEYYQKNVGQTFEVVITQNTPDHENI